MKKEKQLRSLCPINYALESIGDKWTLLVIRDFIFDGKRYYKDFLNSSEGIATNVLSDRLKKLEHLDIIRSQIDENKRTQKIYSLTPKGKDLVPLLIEMIAWSARYKDGLNVEEGFLDKLQTNRQTVIEKIRIGLEHE